MDSSGQKLVTTAGTAVTMGTGRVNGSLMIKALSTNTGLVYVGNDGAGDVTSANGFELDAGEAVVFEYVGSMASLYLDSAEDGEGVSWIVLKIM